MLKDPAFRQALNWAIDRQKVVDVGYFGHGQPATSIIRAGYYKPPIDYHWQPAADEEYAFDPAKAALDAADYKDTDGDGVLDYKGEPIVLRLFARSQSATDQRVGKLITGWLDAIGLKIDYQILDEGAMVDKIYNLNENLLAWRDGVPDVTAPDLICFFAETREPVTNPHHQAGAGVTVSTSCRSRSARPSDAALGLHCGSCRRAPAWRGPRLASPGGGGHARRRLEPSLAPSLAPSVVPTKAPSKAHTPGRTHPSRDPSDTAHSPDG